MYKYKINLSFETSALFPSVKEILDKINKNMDELAYGTGNLIIRSNGFSMSIQADKEITTSEKDFIATTVLDTFEKYFPDGRWLIDSFELIESPD